MKTTHEQRALWARQARTQHYNWAHHPTTDPNPKYPLSGPTDGDIAVGALVEDLHEMIALYCIALGIIDKPGQVLDVDAAKAREVCVRKFGEETAAELFGRATLPP